jgi:hypothetical protein
MTDTDESSRTVKKMKWILDILLPSDFEKYFIGKPTKISVNHLYQPVFIEWIKMGDKVNHSEQQLKFQREKVVTVYSSFVTFVCKYQTNINSAEIIAKNIVVSAAINLAGANGTNGGNGGNGSGSSYGGPSGGGGGGGGNGGRGGLLGLFCKSLTHTAGAISANGGNAGNGGNGGNGQNAGASNNAGGGAVELVLVVLAELLVS